MKLSKTVLAASACLSLLTIAMPSHATLCGTRSNHDGSFQVSLDISSKYVSSTLTKGYKTAVRRTSSYPISVASSGVYYSDGSPVSGTVKSSYSAGSSWTYGPWGARAKNKTVSAYANTNVSGAWSGSCS